MDLPFVPELFGMLQIDAENRGEELFEFFFATSYMVKYTNMVKFGTISNSSI
jgi:hypothetical protein